LDSCLREARLTPIEINHAALAVVGKLVHPASERGTRHWLQHVSGLGELLGIDVRLLSNNALYRISDLLYAHREILERHLRSKEKDLFSLHEKIILYDLTNTYFEGNAKGNKKARRGHAKQKRHDRPLVTLGLIIDELGFVKASKLFSGNVSEGKTLLEMVEALQYEEVQVTQLEESKIKKRGVTVIVDAGLSKEDNLKLLRNNGYDYVVVARNRPIPLSEVNPDELLTIKEDRNNKVEAALFKGEKENVLYCKSSSRLKKETSIRSRYQEHFEEGLKAIATSLTKKGGIKRYEKVLERIGRLKEKYAPIGRYYRIEVKQAGGRVTEIQWDYEKQKAAQERFSGSYFLRTSRLDLGEQEIWSLYAMLTRVEDAFRSLKNELKLRPIYHQKERRSDGHLFITVLAYHLLNSIQAKLYKKGIQMRWSSIRTFLSSHTLVTTSMTNIDGKRIHIRDCSELEPFHRQIYNALGLRDKPLKAKRV